MANNDPVELELELIHSTEDAHLFSDGDSEAWLPRALIQSMDEADEEDTFVVTIPEWLAKDRGLI